jgi:phosphoserine phosphatase RsbU/P
MPKGNARKLFPPGFKLLQFELVLLLVAICICVVLWILHQPASILAILFATFVTSNFSLAVFHFTAPLFRHRPAPWNWIGYIPGLLLAGIVAAVVAEVPNYFLTGRHPDIWQALLRDGPFAIVVALIVGIVYLSYENTRARLEARNAQLQSQVQLGLMETQGHQSELEQAHDIQVHLLPRETPQIPGFQIACAWQPARTVSGDYFDVLPLGKDRLGLCIADVSGKGIAAALLMANLQASVKAFTEDLNNPAIDSPAALCSKLNTVLSNNIAPGRFVTLFYGILQTSSTVLKYENAGHCLPLLVHADKTIDFPAAYSGVLGLFSHWTYSDREVELRPGDVLVLTTDGVLEAANQDEEEFGYQRLIASVIASRDQGVHAIRQRVLADVTAFCSNQFQDDASLIVVTVD